MGRVLSFAWTSEALLAGKKTQTRRNWKKPLVKPGDICPAYDKSPCCGGKRLGYVFILDARQEPLEAITPDDVRREGGPWKTPEEYIRFWLGSYPGSKRTDLIYRVAFVFLPPSPCPGVEPPQKVDPFDINASLLVAYVLRKYEVS